MQKKIIVLISGRGSNLKAMCSYGLTSSIACVISNNSDATGLDLAKQFNLNTHIINHKEYQTRTAFDEKLSNIIDQYNPNLIVLAGFMRVLSAWFTNKYKNKIINIHPSLLPSFIGINAQKQASEAKIKITGATVHFVTEHLDYGPIIAQGIVPNTANDNVTKLAEKVLFLEHKLYPFIIQKFLTNKISFNHDGYVIVEPEDSDAQILGNFYPTIFY